MIGMERGFLFHDRRDAGRILAGRLQGMDLDDPVVVALPRGGVPVGYEVARALGVPLDVFIVRKLGAVAVRKWRWGDAHRWRRPERRGRPGHAHSLRGHRTGRATGES